MKRRGYILLEALIALFLIASLSAVLYPFAAEAVRAVDLMAKRSRIAGEEKTYRFFLDQEKLKLDVYGRTTEPVTGTTSGKEEYALTCEEGSLFVKNGEGSLAISFSILHRPSGEMMDFRTSLLSYADFYRKGQRYE